MDKEFIDFLKSKISIVDVISGRIRLRKSGKDWFGLCPFHKEKTGSFKVDAEKGYYYCFGCGAHGDIISFIQDFNKINFSEAVEYLANCYGIPLPQKEKKFFDPQKPVYEAMSAMKNWFAFQLKENIGEKARNYLTIRGISDESLEKFQLGFSSDTDNLIKHLRDLGFSKDILLKTGVFNKSKYHSGLINRYERRLMFPIMDSVGKCVGFGGRILDKSEAAKYINSPETEIFVKSDHLYGYNLAKRGTTREIILTEGYLDVISMHQAGFDGAVAPLGTSISETQISMCWNICNNPIISLDGDIAGIKASYRWIDKILQYLQPGKSFRFARLPEGADPDSLVLHNQIYIIKEAVQSALPLSEWMWEGAFLLYPTETPEQKAAIIKMLTDKINAISDLSIKRLYFQNLKQKENDLYRKKTSIVSKKENVYPVISVRKKIEKIFIVTILNHPHIINKVIESFVKLEFGDLQMQQFKKRILDCYNSGSGISELKNEISSQTIKEATLHAGFAETTASDEEAIAGWAQLMEKYCTEPNIIKDLQNAASELKLSFSKSEWQRLKTLKQEAISGRIINHEDK
ncbi:MAG: DNA primase [Holosporaceae bacterium]|jgi:DNA primase|nr:DNA primase [Holosporaceae bacterium]